MTIVPCTRERHAAAILDVLNDAIVHTTAIYDYVPRTAESIVAWFDAKERGGFPVDGMETGAGTLAASPPGARSAPGRPTSTRSSTPSTSAPTTAGRASASG